jgi:hypothetical protein
MGEHDIKVEMSKLKFVDEPVRTSSTSSSNSNNSAANNSSNANSSTTGSNTRANNSGSSSASNANDHKWYPDHAVLSGASKDQLKNMPQFKYD